MIFDDQDAARYRHDSGVSDLSLIEAGCPDACGAAGGPRPEKIVPADWPECIEHFAAEKETWLPSALERDRIELV
jgi:hypothetical protein